MWQAPRLTWLFIGRATNTDNEFVLVSSNDPGHTLPISTSGFIEPGTYFISIAGTMRTLLPENSTAGNATLIVTPIGNESHWINPAGGDFGTASNWNPALVPGATDTAIFDLSGAAPITVAAQNEIVARLLNHGMDLELHGSVQVSSGQFGFIVDQGGQLLLNNGATLATQDALVEGPTGSQSTVFVSGAGTQWTIAFNARVIGNGTVVVVNDGSLNAQKSILLGDRGARHTACRVRRAGADALLHNRARERPSQRPGRERLEAPGRFGSEGRWSEWTRQHAA